MKRKTSTLLYSGTAVLLYLEDLETMAELVCQDKDHLLIKDSKYEYDNLEEFVQGNSEVVKYLVISRKEGEENKRSPFRITIKRGWPPIEIEAEDNELNELPFLKVKELLSTRQRPLKIRLERLILAIGALSICLSIFLLSVFIRQIENTSHIRQEVLFPSAWIVLVILIVGYMGYFIRTVITSGRLNKVVLRYRKNQTSFYKRNKDSIDKIIVGAISATIGGLIGAMLKK